MLNSANAYRRAGLSIIPVNMEKKPVIPQWGQWQKQLPPITKIGEWFKTAISFGIALICGRVSGNTACVDIDLKYDITGKLWDDYSTTVTEQAPDLINRLVRQQTMNSGLHLILKCSKIIGNLKLASRPSTSEELAKDPKDVRKVLIETRGDGGYCLIYPTPGYSLVNGNLTAIPEISPDELDILLTTARLFDKMPLEPAVKDEKDIKKASSGNWEKTPFDDFNERSTAESVVEMLQLAGWSVSSQKGDVYYMLRPGKQGKACSATVNYHPKMFFCFSSSTPFEPNRGYLPASVYTILQHNRDYKVSAKALIEKGFGKKAIKAVGVSGSGVRFTDSWNAEFLVKNFGDDIRYNHTYGKWFLWNEKRWVPDESDQIITLATASARKIIESIDQTAIDIPEVYRHALRSEQRKGLADTIELAKSLPAVAMTAKEFDKDVFLFNCENGTLDLRSQEVCNHLREHFITKLAPVTFDKEATAPGWQAFLNKIFNGHSNLISFVQRLIGISLTGDTSEQIMIFFYGSGANGKSVFLETVKLLLGDYYQKAPATMLMTSKGSPGIPNDVARLPGARLAVCSEIQDNQRLNEALVKDLTGGDTVTARFLHKEFFEFKPTHKLLMCGNHKPIVRGTDEGIWRRLVLVPFSVTIPAGERRPMSEMLATFKAELSGILNWAVSGYQDYIRNGLKIPSEVHVATGKYREDSDVLQTFLEEVTEQGVGFTVRCQALYGAYKQWCDTNNEFPLNSRRLSDALKERGFANRAGAHNRYEWIGLRLRPDGMEVDVSSAPEVDEVGDKTSTTDADCSTLDLDVVFKDF